MYYVHRILNKTNTDIAIFHTTASDWELRQHFSLEYTFLFLTGVVNATTEKTVHMNLFIFHKRRVKLLLSSDEIKTLSAEDGKNNIPPKTGGIH